VILIPFEHKFKFEQLSKESQEMVLDKTIDFQGCEVTMRSVLQRHGNVQHVLGPELVTDLITEGTSVNIGGRLQESRLSTFRQMSGGACTNLSSLDPYFTLFQ